MKSNTSNKDFLMIAKTMHGLENVLAKELKAIDAKNIKKRKKEQSNFMVIKKHYINRIFV